MSEDSFQWTDQKLIKSYLHTDKSNGNHGLTAGEIERAIDRPGTHRRLSEMEKMGLVRRIGKRKCLVTGKMRDVWHDDDSPPRPKKHKKPLVHEIRVLRDRIKFLEDEVARLTNETTNR